MALSRSSAPDDGLWSRGRSDDLVEVPKLVAFYRESVVKNASYLLRQQLRVLLSGLGFVFWVVAARLFSKSDIGVATVVLTAASFIVSLGLLGLDAGIVRFLSTAEDPQAQLSSQPLTVVGGTTLLAGAIFVVLTATLLRSWRSSRGGADMSILALHGRSRLD